MKNELYDYSCLCMCIVIIMNIRTYTFINYIPPSNLLSLNFKPILYLFKHFTVLEMSKINIKTELKFSQINDRRIIIEYSTICNYIL